MLAFLLACTCAVAVASAQGPLLVPQHPGPGSEAAATAPAASQAPHPGNSPQELSEGFWSQDRLEFAAGALVTRRPSGWWVEERPRGNYVFLWIAPHRPPRGWAALPQGLWATFVPRGPGSRPRGITAAQVHHVVRTLAGGRFVLEEPGRPFSWHGHRGLLFRGTRSGETPSWTISALGVETPWGEYYTGIVASDRQAPLVEETWHRWLRQSRLRAPQQRQWPQPAAQMAPAAALLGWWKAPRGQMYFGPRGEVVLQFDRRSSFEPGPDGTLRYDRPLVQLRGNAVAREDLLLVTWADGSRTNYRWRLYQGDLLLTDHLGRTSRLKPLARWDR